MIAAVRIVNNRKNSPEPFWTFPQKHTYSLGISEYKTAVAMIGHPERVRAGV